MGMKACVHAWAYVFMHNRVSGRVKQVCGNAHCACAFFYTLGHTRPYTSVCFHKRTTCVHQHIVCVYDMNELTARVQRLSHAPNSLHCARQREMSSSCVTAEGFCPFFTGESSSSTSGTYASTTADHSSPAVHKSECRELRAISSYTRSIGCDVVLL